jgi:hypothetical protein
VQAAQAKVGPISDRDLDKDGVVSDLEDQYHRAKRAVQLSKDPALRAKIAAQKGEAWLVAQEALVQRIDSQIKSGVKLYVDDVMGETPKAGSKKMAQFNTRDDDAFLDSLESETQKPPADSASTTSKSHHHYGRMFLRKGILSTEIFADRQIYKANGQYLWYIQSERLKSTKMYVGLKKNI